MAPSDQFPGPSDQPAESLALAREAWAARGAGHKWTLWVRLSFAQRVSEGTATGILEQWARALRRDMPGAALLVGVHDDTECLHAHALVFVPRRFADPWRPPGVARCGNAWESWLAARWTWGQVWVAEYSHALSSSESTRHGAASYLARDPGAVMQWGHAPLLRS